MDTGAAVSLLNARVNLERNQQHRDSHCAATMERKKALLRGVGILVCLLGVLHEFEGSFVVSDGLVVDAIVGLDFIQKHNCVIDSGKKLLRFPAVNLSVGLHGVRAAADKNTTKNRESVGLVTMQQILVPPESEMELMVKAAGSVTEGVWMVENNSA